ncbi:MurR/RpiR family transcriptional regulator [Paracoccus cavernae]|uniref:MurR/RpiR family transcriptional regulator n=1 Tax=Paracoccus cavernae TaxID=1571207 RepID=UPI00363262AC
MSQNGPLHQQLIDRFDEMSPQLQQAARYLIENPQEIALRSMRELARNAGVQPATMTRLAKFIELSGYEDLRREQARLIRQGGEGFVHRALESDRNLVAGSPEGLAQEVLGGLAAQIEQLRQPQTIARLTGAADCLAGARRIYVQGARSCHSVAWQFHYVLSLMGEKTVLLEAPGARGPMP